MELKTCKRCGKEKTIDEYRRSGKRSDGSIYYRATCKVCDLELEHKRKKEKGIVVKSTRNVDKKPEPVHQKYECKFSEEEIKKLKHLLQEDTIKHHNFMVDYKFNKKTRVKATYNLEKEVKELLDNYCKTNIKNISDVVNIALLKFLKP